MFNINTMVWCLPILFMLHDFEEIIMIGSWKQRFRGQLNTSAGKKQPYEHFIDTASFSIAVGLLFLIQVIISFFSVLLQSYYVWYGVFFAFTVHLAMVHIPLTIRFTHFVPGVFTAVIMLPLCIYILFQSAFILPYSIQTMVISCILSGILVGILFMRVNLLIQIFNRWLDRYGADTHWD